MTNPRDIRACAHVFFNIFCARDLAKRTLTKRALRKRNSRIASNRTFYNRIFKSSQNICDWLVHCCYSSNRNRPWNYANSIRAVARIFRLPKLILAPPAKQIVVDYWHKRHWLRVFSHQSWEPCGIHWNNICLRCIWELFNKIVQSFLRIFKNDFRRRQA